jgi:hypothetical protein
VDGDLDQFAALEAVPDEDVEEAAGAADGVDDEPSFVDVDDDKLSGELAALRLSVR